MSVLGGTFYMRFYMSFLSLRSILDGTDRNCIFIMLLLVQPVAAESFHSDPFQLPAKNIATEERLLETEEELDNGLTLMEHALMEHVFATRFAPVVVIAPGAKYDGSDNEVHWVGSRLMYERKTGWKLPVIQLLQHQNLEELLEVLVQGGFTHILLARTLWDNIDTSVLERWPEIYWISVGTHLDVSTAIEGGLNFQQWRPDYPLYQYLFLLSTFINRTLKKSEEVAHNESETSSMHQWIWHIHPKFEHLMYLKDHLECFAEAFAANNGARVKILWEASPPLAVWGVRFAKGFAIANIQYQNLKTQERLVNLSIFTRYDTLAYQALLHAKEAPFVSGDYPVSASSGSILLLSDSGIISPYFENMDSDDMSAKVYEKTLNSCIPVK